MKLLVKNTWSIIADGTSEEVAWLDHVLSFPDRRLLINRVGDGRVHLLSPLGHKFPTGLMPTVRATARRDGIPLEIDSQRTRPCPPDQTVNLGWLRQDQRDAVTALWKYSRGIIHMPPAAGKGEIDVAIVASIPCPWLFLVHRAQLAKDIAERFTKRFGLPAGFIGDGEWTEGSRLTCATFQSMHAALSAGDPRAERLVREARGLIVDEVHATPADTFMAVVAACENAYWRAGLSATPLSRGDQKNLWTEGMIGPVIYPPGDDYQGLTARLIAQGVISAPRIRMIALSQEADEALSWRDVHQQLIVDSVLRNSVLQTIFRVCARPAMAFVERKVHGVVLSRLAERTGMRVEWMDGSRSVRARQAAATRLGRGELDLIVCTPIMDTGVDIPPLAATINASGGQSAIATIQRLGRGARVTSTKRSFEVWDVLDRGQRWLTSHASARRKAYKAEGYEVEVVDPASVQDLAGQTFLI